MKVNLAHDYLNQWGGGERVLEIFEEIYPNSVIKTITWDKSILPSFSKFKIETSALEKFPFAIKKYKWYLVLMPYAVKSLKFNNVDLVLSDSSGFIKGIDVPKNTMHVCYIHTSTRYLTVDLDYFKYNVPKILHPILPTILNYLKKQDYIGSQKPNYYIANSKTTARRVKKYYNREVDLIIFPPVDTKKFHRKTQDQDKDYYLIAGRLMPYKKVDLAISTFNKLGKKLVVIGTGNNETYLKKIAGPTIEFWGRVSDEKLRQAYAECKGLIFPPLEDAGMIPLEAMACGKPVIAYGKGGALESVVDGKTGIFFYNQTVDDLENAIKRFEKLKFNSSDIIKHASTFSSENFKIKIKQFIDSKYILFHNNLKS